MGALFHGNRVPPDERLIDMSFMDAKSHPVAVIRSKMGASGEKGPTTDELTSTSSSTWVRSAWAGGSGQLETNSTWPPSAFRALRGVRM